MDVDELAPDMGHAGDLADGARALEILKVRIAVRCPAMVCLKTMRGGMHPAAVSGEMVLRMLAFPVTEESMPGGRWRITAPRPFITRIGSASRGLGLSAAGGEHVDRCVIREVRIRRQDMAPNGIGERFQQGRGFADPVSQCRAIQIETFTVEDLALTKSGRWSAYLLTSTWASRPGPGRPRSLGREGSGAWKNRSLQAQVRRGRMMRFTMKRPGTYSSSSVTSSPIRRRRPP